MAEEAAVRRPRIDTNCPENIKTLIEDGDVDNIEDFKEKLTQADNVTRVENTEERKEQISEMRGYQKNME